MTEIKIDELIRSKRKTVSLAITKDAKLVVRVPLRMPLKEIDKIILEKKNWIITKKEQAVQRINQQSEINFQPGGSFLFLGNTYTFAPDSDIEQIHIKDGVLYYPPSYIDDLSYKIKDWCQNKGRKYLPIRLKQLSELLNIPYTGCTITSAKTRWGSCSAKNRISLTWRLIMADSRAIDYVIVHELCHVVHKNHSSKFWSMVGKIMPDYKDRQKWLKDHSYILDLFSVYPAYE